MFCNLFCSNTNDEVVKKSAFTEVVDDAVAASSITTIPPLDQCDHATTTNKEIPLSTTVVGEEFEFKVVATLPVNYPGAESVTSINKSKSENIVQTKKNTSISSDDKTFIGINNPNGGLELEGSTFISGQDLLQALQKMDKENAWHEKRLAKKATGGKKKSPRPTRQWAWGVVPAKGGVVASDVVGVGRPSE